VGIQRASDTILEVMLECCKPLLSCGHHDVPIEHRNLHYTTCNNTPDGLIIASSMMALFQKRLMVVSGTFRFITVACFHRIACRAENLHAPRRVRCAAGSGRAAQGRRLPANSSIEFTRCWHALWVLPNGCLHLPDRVFQRCSVAL
jgi:hypothetical protein